MSFPYPNKMFFAKSSYEDADYVIFGVPYDGTATFRKGTRFGPVGIRADSAANFERYLYDYKLHLDDVKVFDAGDLDMDVSSPEEMVERVNKFSRRLVSDGKFPIMLGGEHSITPAVATAFDDIAVLGIDAHGDSRDEFDGSKNNHGCAMRRIIDKFGEDRVMWVGVRALDKSEHESSAKFIDSLSILKNGIDWTISKIVKDLPFDRIYLSLDIDGIDPAFAPGTGTPEPYGLHPFDVKRIINALAPKMVGFDVVEVSPPLDKGITTLLGARFVCDVVGATFTSRMQK